MVFHERKRAAGRLSVHNERPGPPDLPPPPPPKKPCMSSTVKHFLLPRQSLEIYLHGWKVKLDDGNYAKTWISDKKSYENITPSYIPERFDILGEKLDKAFLNIDDTDSTTFTSVLNDSLIDDKIWDKTENYTFPSEASLELSPLFTQDELTPSIPPPPPPPPSTSNKIEDIGVDQLEKSQYSPTHDIQYEEDMDIEPDEEPPPSESPSKPATNVLSVENEDYRKQQKTSESSSDYLSADEDFPPPAPSPPSIPNTPSPAPKQEETDDVTMTETVLPPDSTLKTPRVEENARSSRSPCKSSASTVSFRGDGGAPPELIVLEDDEPTKNIPEKQEPPAQLEENIMDGKNFEDIDSPDELEEDFADEEENPPRPQISLFREIITDSGEIKRVLYFRKSKFRMTGTALSQLSKMSARMDYEDACRNSGFPELLNKGSRPSSLGRTLSDRIENPKKKLPIHRHGSSKDGNFGVPLTNLTRSIKVKPDQSTSVKMRNFGMPLRQIRNNLFNQKQPRTNHVQVRFSNNPFVSNSNNPFVSNNPFISNNTRLGNNTLTRSEQLISEFCTCWVQRPFHDTRCATTHDNFVETILKRHGKKYPVVKECIREYSMQIGPGFNDPVRSFNLFKSIMNSKT